jgi:predicted methyltransferase
MEITLINHSHSLQYFLLTCAAVLITGCADNSGSDDAQHDQAAPDLATLLASDARFDGDHARDAGRKPAAVLEFLGVEPGMSVVDIIGAGGYYTEVLSLAVGPDGHVAAMNPAAIFELLDGAMGKELNARMADSRLPNVTQLNKEFAELSADDGPFDVAITALNLHDVYNRGGEEGAIQTLSLVSGLLKPGGVFGVIDHHGSADNDNVALHRMQLSDAIRVAEAAGFVVEANSGILHVHSDDLSKGVFAEGSRGRTNRFLLKLRKPDE